MSILEKKTGSEIDALIISLIMAKVFLLEYLGMAGIVNNVIFLLIGVRLIFSGWKIPKKLLFLVCLITMLLVLSYSAGSIVPGKTSYNLKAIQTFFFYALFIVMLKTNGSDLLDFGKQRWIVFFNVVYAVNCIVILIQVYYPYSLMAAAPMTGQIPFYEDLISGLFMYASTHAVALFSCFVLLIDLNSIRDGSGELRIPVVCCAAAVLASSLGIAALNDNKALFALMPIVLLLFYAEGLSSINFMRIAKGLMFLAVLLGIVFLLYICNSSFANFFDDNVLSLFDLVESSSSIGTDAVGSGERIAIIGYALNLASSWLFGIGLGAATFHEGAFCGFTHFGQADFGSLVILLGVWFLIALFAFYVFCVSCGCRGRRPYVLYLSLVALATTATIYTQCFTRANNALLFLLIGLALVERWKSIAQSTSALSKE